MKPLKLWDNFLKNNMVANQISYRKRNNCASLFQKENKKFLEKLHNTKVTDNKQFWRFI